MELDISTENLLNGYSLFSSGMNTGNRPCKENLEDLLDKLFAKEKNFPKEFILLGSYGLVMSINLLKGEDIAILYRDTKDLDLALFPNDDDYITNQPPNRLPSSGMHMIIPLERDREFYAEVFTYGSLSDMIGEGETVDGRYADIIDYMYEHPDESFVKFEYKDHVIYVPKPFILISMKVRAYEKRSSDDDKIKDKNDLAFLRGYIPGVFNNALNKISELGKEYKVFKAVREKYDNIFNP